MEQNLIKRHRPPFNIRLRDDKSYPYIAVTDPGRVPAGDVHARAPPQGGAATSGRTRAPRRCARRSTSLNRVFPYRPCEGPAPGRRSGVPCLDYHIGRCAAPCVGLISQEDYAPGDRRRGRVPVGARPPARARARGADAGGRSGPRVRGRRALPQPPDGRPPPGRAPGRRPRGTVAAPTSSAVASEGDTANVQLFHLRDGRLVDRRSFYLENALGESASGRAVGVRRRVLRRSGGDSRPADRARGVRGSGAAGGLPGRAPRVGGRGAPGPRGEKRRLAELAQTNAELALKHDALLAQRTRARRVEALEELRERLNLESLPVRIECFDISNLGETNRVASMVVFEERVAKRSHYRSFGDPARPGPGRLRAAWPRRSAAGLPGWAATRPGSGSTASFSSTPNLVRDRRRQGAAQRGAEGDGGVRPAARRGGRAGQARGGDLPARAAARRWCCRATTPACSCVQRIRDEAHRFALGHHRKRRGKAAVDSIFNTLPGVGAGPPAAADAALRAPRSAASAPAARSSRRCPGSPARWRGTIHASLHKTG